MMQPKKTKFRKAHKGRIHGAATSGATLSFGQFGLKAMAPERITARQIEAARRALTRHMKRAGRVWIRVFPDVPVSKKPAEVRMGSGKGTPELWVARVNRRFTHPIYKKTIRRSKNYHAHDENNEFKPGDQVWIEESKPISKMKRWTVVRGEQKKTA